MSSNQNAELEALRAQVSRLQAEKNDLVAMNSELQLKTDQDSHEDSFIEIIRVSVSRHTPFQRGKASSNKPKISLQLPLWDIFVCVCVSS